MNSSFPMMSMIVMLQKLSKIIVVIALSLIAIFPSTSFAESDIYINSAKIDRSGNYYRLTTTQFFDLSDNLKDTLHRGIPLYFKTEIELTSRQLLWFDMTALSKTRTTRLSYNVLTRQYSVYISGSLQRSYHSLNSAISAIRYQPSWAFAYISELSDDETYEVAVRISLDVSQLPKPFQINALNSRDWGLASDWKHFYFTP